MAWACGPCGAQDAHDDADEDPDAAHDGARVVDFVRLLVAQFLNALERGDDPEEGGALTHQQCYADDPEGNQVGVHAEG